MKHLEDLKLPIFSDLVEQGLIERPSIIDENYVESKWDRVDSIQEFKFTQLPMERLKWRHKLKRQNDLRLALKQDITPVIREELYRIRHNRMNFICGVHGDTGRGKSSIFLALAEYLKPVENAALFGFNPFQMLERIRGCEVGTVAGLDENPNNYGAGSGRVKQTLSSIIDICRAHRLSFFRVCPNINDGLPAQQYSIQIYDRDMTHLVTRAFVFDDKLYPIGMILVPMPAPQTWEHYETAKMANIEDVIESGDLGGALNVVKEFIPKILAHPQAEIAKTKGEFLAILAQVGGHGLTKDERMLIVDQILLDKKYNEMYG